MSPDQRLGSDPLSWLKNQDEQPEADSPLLADPGFHTPQDTIDEICAANKEPAPLPSWRPREVLEHLDTPLCVFDAQGLVLYMNPAWQAAFEGQGPAQDSFFSFFQEPERIQPLAARTSPVALCGGATGLVTCWEAPPEKDQPGFWFATLALAPAAPPEELAPEAAEPAPALETESPAAVGQVMQAAAQWGDPGPEAAARLAQWAAAQSEAMQADQLGPESLSALLQGCVQVLEGSFQMEPQSLRVDIQARVQTVSREHAVLAGAVLMELLALCLKDSPKRVTGNGMRCLIEEPPKGGLRLRVFGDRPLIKSKTLAFNSASREDLGFLAEMILHNRGALLAHSGAGQELRAELK